MQAEAVRRRDAVAPVGRETVNARVFAELRRSLAHGVFEAGEVLRIVDLAGAMQTSTMPVREALARLVSERALEALPNRSVRVPLITRERLDDLARARCLLEGELTTLALPRLGEADFAALRALTLDGEAAFRIYAAAGSAVLIAVVESLWLQSGPYVRVAARIHEQDGHRLGVHHHWSLIEALERRDPAGAVAALTADIRNSFDLIRTRLATEAIHG